MLGKRLRRWLWPTALTILAAIANILYSGVSFIYYPITLPGHGRREGDVQRHF